MIFLITAMYIEAKPLINMFQLKKDTEINRFQIFSNEKIVLIITGTGTVKAAAAVSFVLSKFSKSDNDVVINIGTAGTNNPKVNINNVYICNKIINNDSKRTFYPDMIYQHDFMEGCLETFSVPVSLNNGCCDGITGDFVDMEGAAVFEAASIFLPPHRIAIVKIISDRLSIKNITPKLIETIINNHTNELKDWLDNIYLNYNHIDDKIFNEKEVKLLEALIVQLKLSKSMQYQLFKYAKYYKLNNNEIVSVIEKYAEANCKSKREGKKYFELLKQTLLYA